MPKRKIPLALALGAAACAALAAACTPLRVATGYTSHVLCSETFVGGLSPDVVFDEAIAPAPGLSAGAWAMSYRVDRARKEVTTRVAGGFARRAVYREGLGCLLVADDGRSADVSRPRDEEARAPAALPPIAADDVVAPTTPAMRAAFDRAFAEPPSGPGRKTKAIVVVKDGRVVAERYADGVGPDTRLLGWSMTKSVTSALVAVLVREGRLSVKAPAPVAAWQGERDPRRAITADDLLRNVSGLELHEANDGFDPSSRIMFTERDTAGVAARAALLHPPGTHFDYSSGGFQILSGVVRDAAGGRARDVLAFARRELFDPLGMRSAMLEVDAEGTPLGAAFMLATARDWARFGVLFAEDGVVGGRRILPEGWVRYTSSPTPNSPYAAAFWRGSAAWRAEHHTPDDLFFASGELGQRIVVVPSERLVIVRLGFTQMRPGFDPKGFGQMIADVRSALRAAQVPLTEAHGPTRKSTVFDGPFAARGISEHFAPARRGLSLRRSVLRPSPSGDTGAAFGSLSFAPACLRCS
jgi:CubicO group peptidase (beta-lactamase class C family)